MKGQLERGRVAHADRRLLGPLARRQPLWLEVAAVLVLYGLYEASRGIVAGNADEALDHARSVASAERTLHLFVEGRVQDAAGALPGLVGTLGVLYLTMHLTATCACLLWLHRRRPDAYPLARNALLVASALAVVGYATFPTAPPRLAGLGIADTISGGEVDLDHGFVSALYNPFAAVPSMHIGYALIVGGALVRYGRRPALRVAGVLYPPLVLLVIVATGNHFFLDAAAGAAVAVIAVAASAGVLALARRPRRGPALATALHEFG